MEVERNKFKLESKNLDNQHQINLIHAQNETTKRKGELEIALQDSASKNKKELIETEGKINNEKQKEDHKHEKEMKELDYKNKKEMEELKIKADKMGLEQRNK